ncbi:MAG: hypothetical protein JWR52_2014 [Marmoricola sp.]|nr:hypothetical protein [Marmoricola sp.]
MRQYGPGNPLVLSHIPKTAGTSLTAALVDALQPEVFAHGMDQSLAGGYDRFDQFDAKTREWMYLSPDELPADATLVAGHIGPATTLGRFPHADHITFLRNPEVRVLSQWMHLRALTEFDIRRWGPGAGAVRIGWGSLRQYLEHEQVAPNNDNTIARFLAWPHDAMPGNDFIAESDDEAVLEAARARLDAMAHVDLVENTGFVADFATWLGRPLSEARLNERAFIPKKMRPDFDAELDASTRELMAYRTRIDRRLWQHVADRVLPGQDHQAILDASLGRAVGRYVDSFDNPVPWRRPVRNAVAFLYNSWVR